jgi:hypothetical protein
MTYFKPLSWYLREGSGKNSDKFKSGYFVSEHPVVVYAKQNFIPCLSNTQQTKPKLHTNIVLSVTCLT